MRKGFTLIELLVVIAIIGILAGVVTVSVGNAQAKARDAKKVSDISSLQTALEMYYNDTGSYRINNCSGSWIDVYDRITIELKDKGYLSSIPKSPVNGQPYYFSCPNKDNYRIYVNLENTNNQILNSDYDGIFYNNISYYINCKDPSYCVSGGINNP